MNDRRNFLKTALIAVSGMAIGQVAVASESVNYAGIVYSANNPGKWKEKVKGHAPEVNIEGKTVTITTNHGMTSKHYIVRHSLVAEDGTVLGATTFNPTDKKAVSTYELPEGNATKFYVTSFCNKHDLWVTEFTI
ncbi:MAG: twin-arginine translocation signal domain-containing protein [Proteobacteria bacterium]|nr:twin-arginine translocation signal domain-containing protein [Pseudomonadota bacterium]